MQANVFQRAWRWLKILMKCPLSHASAGNWKINCDELCARLRAVILFLGTSYRHKWPPWVICTPAFNHKIGNAAHSGVSEVLFFTKSYKWKEQRLEKWTTGRLLLEIMYFWRSPTVCKFKMAGRRKRAQQKFKLLHVVWQCPDYSLVFPCSISFAESFVFTE